MKKFSVITYSVKATSNDGVTSELSNEFSISTKDKVEDPSTGDYRVFKLGSLTEPEIYTQGEVVSYKGNLYTTLQTHSNYGDTSWNPAEATSLFEFQSDLEEETPIPAPDTTWESKQVYNAGEKIIFEGLEYEAQWWTQGNSPEKSDVWKLVSNKSVKWNVSKAYSAGDNVTFEGKTYQAQWWTQGNKPDTSSVWVLK